MSYQNMDILEISAFTTILAIFYCACATAETTVSEFPITILASPLDSTTAISYNRAIWRSDDVLSCFLTAEKKSLRYFYSQSI